MFCVPSFLLFVWCSKSSQVITFIFYLLPGTFPTGAPSLHVLGAGTISYLLKELKIIQVEWNRANVYFLKQSEGPGTLIVEFIEHYSLKSLKGSKGIFFRGGETLERKFSLSKLQDCTNL